MSKPMDLTGLVFGKLMPLYNTGMKGKKGCYIWKCKCECGNFTESRCDNLRYGTTKSCGKCKKINIYNKDSKDKRKYPEYKKWRKLVYERDRYTCQTCKDVNGGNLIAHHLNNYLQFINQRTDVDNGVTLCKNCHNYFHHLYGIKNNTKIQFSEWKDRLVIVSMYE